MHLNLFKNFKLGLKYRFLKLTLLSDSVLFLFELSFKHFYLVFCFLVHSNWYLFSTLWRFLKLMLRHWLWHDDLGRWRGHVLILGDGNFLRRNERWRSWVLGDRRRDLVSNFLIIIFINSVKFRSSFLTSIDSCSDTVWCASCCFILVIDLVLNGLCEGNVDLGAMVDSRFK